MKLKFEEALSNFAFNVNLRRYYMDTRQLCPDVPIEVGRSRMTVSKPELKAPMVSAISD